MEKRRASLGNQNHAAHVELAQKVADALLKNERFKKEIRNTIYLQAIHLELDKYGYAREAVGKTAGETTGIIEMGIAANLDPAMIISTLSMIGKMPAGTAWNVYTVYDRPHR